MFNTILNKLNHLFRKKPREIITPQTEDDSSTLTNTKQQMESGSADAAWSVAIIEWTKGKDKDAIFALKLGLFWTNNVYNPKLRGKLHNMIGVILQQNNCNSSYKSYYKILSHFRKAKIYECENADRNIDNILSRVRKQSVKTALINDTTPICYEKDDQIKIIKTFYAVENKQQDLMTPEENENWLQYKDPRLKRNSPR